MGIIDEIRKLQLSSVYDREKLVADNFDKIMKNYDKPKPSPDRCRVIQFPKNHSGEAR